MSKNSTVNYGPLTGLIGVWKGDKGLDVAPEPDGAEKNPYRETITFTECGTVTNAGMQTLSVLHYHQIVVRKSDNEVFHNETGYWMWDTAEKTIMHSLTIPRGVCVLAGGRYDGRKDYDGNVVLEVSAAVDNKEWCIVQSPFMQMKALTTDFRQKIVVGGGKMTYSETTMLNIYGKTFEHTDGNELTLL